MHKHQMLKNGFQSVSFSRFSTFSCFCFVSHFYRKLFFIIIFRIPPRNTWTRDILLPMANCAAVQPSLSASRWSSLILTSCLRPSSLFTRSFSHWYPFSGEKMEKSVDTELISHGRGPTDRGENYTRAGAQREESP